MIIEIQSSTMYKYPNTIESIYVQQGGKMTYNIS